MRRTCENCQWWKNFHGLKPDAGNCESPAVVDAGGAPEGKGDGVRFTGLHLLTEPLFGCVHFMTPSPQARTRLMASKYHEVVGQVNLSVERTEAQDDAHKIGERVVEYLESLPETEQRRLLDSPTLHHVIRIFTSAL